MKNAILIVCVVVIGFSPYAASGGWPVVRLTDNDYLDLEPVVSETHVAWRGGSLTNSYSDNDNEVFLYEIATGVTTRLTNNYNYRDYRPKIDGSKVVWASEQADSFEIFLHDGDTGVTTPLTNDQDLDRVPDIGNGHVTWRRRQGRSFWLYDGVATVQIPNMQNDGSATELLSPKVWGTNVVVASNRYNPERDYDIFLYDGSVTRNISNRAGNDFMPEVSDAKVVWRGTDGHDSEIFLYDLADGTTNQLSDNEYFDSDPRVSGSNVAWHVDDGNDREIVVYDGSSNTTLQITDNDYDDIRPEISGSSVVWTGKRADGYEIFHYDMSTGVTTQLTDNDVYDGSPQIYGSTVVWVQGSGSDSEILLTQIPEPATLSLLALGGLALLRRRKK